MARKRITLDDIYPNRPWWAVKYLLRDENQGLYEESTVLIKAENGEDALAKAEKHAEEVCESIGYTYTGYAEGFQLLEPEPEELSKVYSSVRKSSLEPVNYIKRYLRTGEEIGFKKEF